MIFLNYLSVRVYLLILLSVAYTLGFKRDVISNPDFNLNSDKHPSLEPLGGYAEEYKLFLEELENGTAKNNGKSRQKRYVYLNTETNLDVGYLIVIPITVVLPSMSNLFNTWRRKRSLDSFNLNNTSEESEPIFQSQVDRISAYFELMNIPEKACQLRALCELSAEPSNYFPLSDIIISKIRSPVPTSQRSDKTNSVKPSLFELFTQAADDGVSFGKQKCETSYATSCKYSIDHLLNMPVMKFWNKLQSKLRLKFEENSELF